MVAAEAIAAGTGPIALDAERASGYRYSQRAYLVQLRREGAGSFLFDPIALPDLSPVNDAIGDAEWVLHAATQDLMCLAEVGLRPKKLFDTELGGRLTGLPRVGLGAIVEHHLGLALAKEHSAADWSVRPLPESWLNYAALDVEVLVALRDAVAADLVAQGKEEIARQEFEALLTFDGPPTRVDPWRRTSGMHRIRKRRGLAVVRALWEERDRIAADQDVASGRILPDAAIVALASTAIDGLPKENGRVDYRVERAIKRRKPLWDKVIAEALALPDAQLPALTTPNGGPPPQRAWVDRDPMAAARLSATRADLGVFAQERGIPIENVVSPESLRRALWELPKKPGTGRTWADLFSERLAAAGARQWQIDTVVPIAVANLDARPTSKEITPDA